MKRQIIFSGIIVLILFAGCKKDKGESNDEELITTMVLTFTPAGGGTPFEVKFEDPDGPGGAPATADNIALKTDGNYQVVITLLNETVNPAENITEEVEEENTAHRFYYERSTGWVTIDNLNEDDNGMPLGTTSNWFTSTGTGTGTVTITLRHYPGIPPDKQTADPVNSPKSSTDIVAVFNYSVAP